jgi:hypothetical protein
MPENVCLPLSLSNFGLIAKIRGNLLKETVLQNIKKKFRL